LIHNLLSKTLYQSKIDINIINLFEFTKTFIKNNPNILFTRADKGNITVALDKLEYVNKIEDMLRDTNTYIEINKDPIKKLTADTRVLLTRWKNKGYTTQGNYNSIYCSDGNLPRAYGLPKIHKPGLKFRLIISTIDSPTHSLEEFLHKIISKNVIKPSSHVLNSHQLVKQLNGLPIENDLELISLDVISLFTNIPKNLAIDSINKRWNDINRGTIIPKTEFITAINLILKSTFFVFNNRIYKQKCGMLMGSPLSPIIADLVMQDLEAKALDALDYDIPFYHRYVDDIALAVPRHKINDILTIFNSLHSRLQFTLEIGGNKLDFLDVTLINHNNKLEFDCYRKPTFSGRVLNYFSHHPPAQKKGVIMSMVDRAFLLSHPKFHQKNLKFIIETFLNNNYPLKFIFDTIHERLKILFRQRSKKQIVNNSNDEIKKG